MKSLFKIYRRYILSAGWIAAVVILVNMCVMMMVGTYFALPEPGKPGQRGKAAAHGGQFPYEQGKGRDAVSGRRRL